jgi:transposase
MEGIQEVEGTVTIASGKSDAEATVIGKQRWEEIRRMAALKKSVSEIARTFGVDRKTVRRCLQEEQWHAYQRKPRDCTLLTEHSEFMKARAAEVDYSAQILYQELKFKRGYRGSYETVKRAVAPLRKEREAAEVCQTRFETEPGHQAQIDWGQVQTQFRGTPVRLHVFVMTLGYSRRGYYTGYANEQMGALLEAHENGFEHFGGLCRELLYDRMRTVCEPDRRGGFRWNVTFKKFAEHWGFEPRLCLPYRAQTKGKVESGVKYVKGNFMPGRQFIDIVDFDAQLNEWMAQVADTRVHGTVHQRPIDRFQQEQAFLMPITGHRRFGHRIEVSRMVADDYLVSFQSNRYSVPFGLIGKPVEVLAEGGRLAIRHGETIVAEHPLLAGKHQMRILPEHGPGAVNRNPRHRFAHPGAKVGVGIIQPM